MIDRRFAAMTFAAALAVGGATFVMAPGIEARWRGDAATGDPTDAEFAAAGAASMASVYYPGCNAVRAAGAAPLRKGQPGYRTGMDGDGDGIACEDYGGGGGGFGGFGRRSRRYRP